MEGYLLRERSQGVSREQARRCEWYCFCLALNSRFLLLNSIFVNFNEFFYGTVIRSLGIIREKAGWELVHIPVIRNAFTADTFTAARLPGAVAVFTIFFTLAFSHDNLRYWFNLLFSKKVFCMEIFIAAIMFNSRIEVVSTDKSLYQKESRIKNVRFFISIRYFLSKKKKRSFLLFK